MSLIPLSLLRNMTKTVCIVGAGPSGLVAAKTLLHNAPLGEFSVTVFDAQPCIGGLWPVSKSDNERQIHPLMVANQSKHTMQFSELMWDEKAPQLPRAWMVGQYLERYMERFLTGNPGFELRLSERVVKAEPPREGESSGWIVSSRRGDGVQTRNFDHVLVASGFFGKPLMPGYLTKNSTVPVIHSCRYRDLESLLGQVKPGGGKILVIGGQMSGVEVAGTIGANLSSAINSPDNSSILDVDKFGVHHVIQRPIWVFPLFTSPKASSKTAPFLPLDFSSYNLNNRPEPLVNTQGHIPEEIAKTVHGIFQNVLGTDQFKFSSLLGIGDEERTKQPYLAVSDWYSDFVRSGFIGLSKGKVEEVQGNTAILSDGSKIEDVAAVVLATGFDPSPCIDFLPRDVLEKLQHSPKHIDQPISLAFHGTHHPGVPGLGFTGFYRSPYWGVMQMQARFLTRLWQSPKGEEQKAKALDEKLQNDSSMQQTLNLRDDPRVSQFPMGDYPFLMQEFAEALSEEMMPASKDDSLRLPHNDKPLDMLTPARYPLSSDDDVSKDNAVKAVEQTQAVLRESLTTPRFVSRAVFRSLLGTWKLERDLKSKLPTHPSGHFSGTAQFLLREKTSDGLRCAAQGVDMPTLASPGDFEQDTGMEYLYIEEGEFKTDQGFAFRATRRYVWRYDDASDTISVWFAKPEDLKRADYLFHEVEFLSPEESGEDGWKAKAGHLCIEDFYDVEYRFAFEAVNLEEWNVGYTVKGPKKDYTIKGTYTR